MKPKNKQSKVPARLLCPYCQTRLKVTETVELYENKMVKTGVASCVCDQFPIVEGIWYVQKKETLEHRRAVQCIENGMIDKAISILIAERKKVKIAFRLLQILSRYRLIQLNRAKVHIILIRWLKAINPESKDWYQYLLTRRWRSTFILSLISTARIKKNAVLLDIGCGQGDFIETASRLTKVKNSIGLDSSFSLLLLARWFTVDTQVLLVCSDVEVGLPFSHRSVDVITINDAFMYLRNKQLVINNSIATLTETGLLSLVHIHLRQATNVGQGFGVSLTEMNTYFKNKGNYLLIPDKWLMSFLLADGKQQKLTKQPVKANSRSISCLFAHHQLVGEWKIPAEVSWLIRHTAIDYSEDADLQPAV